MRAAAGGDRSRASGVVSLFTVAHMQLIARSHLVPVIAVGSAFDSPMIPLAHGCGTRRHGGFALVGD